MQRSDAFFFRRHPGRVDSRNEQLVIMDLLLECKSVESLVEFSLMNSLTLIFVEWAVEDFNEIRYLRSELHDLACRKRHFQPAAVIFFQLWSFIWLFLMWQRWIKSTRICGERTSSLTPFFTVQFTECQFQAGNCTAFSSSKRLTVGLKTSNLQHLNEFCIYESTNTQSGRRRRKRSFFSAIFCARLFALKSAAPNVNDALCSSNEKIGSGFGRQCVDFFFAPRSGR